MFVIVYLRFSISWQFWVRAKISETIIFFFSLFHIYVIMLASESLLLCLLVVLIVTSAYTYYCFI